MTTLNIKHTLKKLTSLICVIILFLNLCVFTEESVGATSQRDLIMISMGDSYSSGEGIDPFFDIDLPLAERVKSEDWLSHRSQNAWSGMLRLPGVTGSMREHIGRKNKNGNWSDGNWYLVAMSGAVTDNILDDELLTEESKNDKNKKYRFKEYKKGTLSGKVPIEPQTNIFDVLKSKGKKADYVTLTLGGNDADFTTVVGIAAASSEYIMPNLLYGTLSYIMTIKMSKILSDLEKSYLKIYNKQDTPPEIIVAGYPHLFGETVVTNPSITPNEAKNINKAITLFNKLIELKIKKLREKKGIKIHFVSVEKGFKGHEAYSTIIDVSSHNDMNNGEFINRIIPGLKPQDIQDSVIETESSKKINFSGIISSYSVHPNLKGAKVYAQCVQEKIDELEKEKGNSYTPTEQNTQPITEPVTQPISSLKTNYTAEDLASKNLSEIIDIMGGDFTIGTDDNKLVYYSSPSIHIYNYNTLPGFVFYIDEATNDYYQGKDIQEIKRDILDKQYSNYSFMALFDKANLNREISANMDYYQLTQVLGEFDCSGVGGSDIGSGYSYTSADVGEKTLYLFSAYDYPPGREYQSGVTRDWLKPNNPKLKCILVYPNKNLSNTTPNNSFSDLENNEYKQYLGSWGVGSLDGPYVGMEFVSIEGNIATFNLTQLSKNVSRFATANNITANIKNDNTIDFNFDDSFSNHGHGTITLNQDTIHLVTVIDEYSGQGYGITCDSTLTKK